MPGCGPAEESARRPRYLIVDDDGVCRELLKDVLSIYGQCDFAYDGLEAVDAVRLALEDGTPYHLVCLDIMMPGSSGHASLEAIRQVEAERGVHGSDGVPVIMTTALRDSKHCVQAFREGCESYVTKPIREDELLARMHELHVLMAE
ncbi:MAG: response regulator transcription factor [Pirellulales bacterium]|nr:response regulator transcription factor [Pirellulales bacterium]